VDDLRRLSDAELVESLRALEARQRETMAAIVAHLVEIEERRLHLRLGYSSLFDYCQRALGLSEDEAYRRMTVSRMASKWPAIVEGLEDGSLHMSGVALLKPHLRAENCTELLEMARGASRRELERRLAARFPQADSAEFLRAQKVKPLSAERFALQLTIGEATRAKLERAVDLMSRENPSRSLEAVLDRALDVLVKELERTKLAKTKRAANPRASATRSDVKPTERDERLITRTGAGEKAAKADTLAGTRDGAARDGVARDGVARDGAARDGAARDGAAREGAASKGAVSERVANAGTRAGAGESAARAVGPRAIRKRAIPRSIRRQVFERDAAQCSFVGENGESCACRSGLELDHIRPWAFGGPSDVANLRVLCRAHNRLAAEEWFGKNLHRGRRERAACGEAARREQSACSAAALDEWVQLSAG